MTENQESDDPIVYAAASALGIVAGLRSMMAPAVVTYIAASQCAGVKREAFGVLGSPAGATTMRALAVGEAIADKLPFMPNRTSPVALTGRILSGGFCGAIVCRARGKSMVVGAVAGALGAIGSTFAAFYVRRELSQGLDVPDAAFGLLEDATAVWAGKTICEGLSRSGSPARP